MKDTNKSEQRNMRHPRKKGKHATGNEKLTREILNSCESKLETGIQRLNGRDEDLASAADCALEVNKVLRELVNIIAPGVDLSPHRADLFIRSRGPQAKRLRRLLAAID